MRAARKLLTLAVTVGVGGGLLVTAAPASAAAPPVSLVSLTPPSSPDQTRSVGATAVVKSTSGGNVAVQAITIAVRDAAGNNYDFPGATAATITPSGYTFTSGTRTFPAGRYTVFAAVEVNNAWTNLTPSQSMEVAVLSDEFSGPSGQGPNYGLTNPVWNNDPCWKNGCTGTDAEYRLDHATLDGSGDLALRADHTFTSGAQCGTGKACTWGTARLTTINWSAGNASFAATGGHIEARIKSPLGKGLWPAFWTVGSAQASGTTWPQSGEVDIMEELGGQSTTVGEFAHAGSQTNVDTLKYPTGQAPYTLPSGQTIAQWHTYAIDWDPSAGGRITWSVDNRVVRTLTQAQADSGSEKDWQFLQNPQALILNLAVGGSAEGEPDSSTPSSATMLVDYVRVFKDTQN